ncbi:MAG: histidine phosphotransferase family protein [Paracoccaceae bacterium]
MQNTTPDLAALIGSRICHDLISPIGAINNGLELLGMAGNAGGPEIGLISESVENASARIRFFRLAFGAASPQEVPTGEVRSIIKDMTRGSKLHVDWTVEGGAVRSDVRLALLAEQCLDTAMPYGGDITISRDVNGWSIRGVAEKFIVDNDLWSILATGTMPQQVLPAHVQFALLAVHSRDEGRKLRTDIRNDEILIRF